MAHAINTMDGHSLSNKVHNEHPSKEDEGDIMLGVQFIKDLITGTVSRLKDKQQDRELHLATYTIS